MACGVVIAALTTSPRAQADDPIALRVRVVADGDCASRETFWSAVSRHSSRVSQMLGADGALVELAIRRSDEEHVVGVLDVTLPGEVPWQRRLVGGSCAEVTDGLALVTALAFDPNAVVEPASPAPTVLPIAEPAAREVPIAPAAGPEARWRGAVLASIGPLVLGTSGPVVGYGISGDLERDRAGLAPSLRLSLTHAEGSIDFFGAGAGLAWTTGRASICPLRADLASSLSLRPCAGLEVGVLVASPVGLVSARSATRAWVAPSLLGRLRWQVVASIFVEGEVGLAAPLVRDQIAADPGITLYRAPALVPLASLSAGVRFP